MAFLDNRYLFATLGHYLVLFDPETKTLYRLAIGYALRIRIPAP